MPEFEFEVINNQGEAKNGKVTAPDKRTAVNQLQSEGYYIASISAKESEKRSFLSLEIGGVSLLNKTLLVEQLAAMLKAGLPLVESLKILAEQTNSTILRVMLEEAASDVSSGIPLSTSFSKHPKLFDNVFIQVLRAGEVSGILEKNLRYLGDELRRRYELNNKIRSAMMYPIVIVVAMIAVGFSLMIFVVPKVTDVLRDSGAELPATTKFLLGASDIMVEFWWLIILAIGALVVLFWWLSTFPNIKRVFSRFWSRVPIVNRVRQKRSLASMTGTLANLVKSGMPIVDAISTTGDTMKDRLYDDALKRVAEKVKKGIGIVQAMEVEKKYFPSIVLGMMRVGERTGEISVVLERLSQLYDNQLQNEIKSVTALVEPILMLLVGAGIGILALAIITPIYSVIGSV